MSERSQVKMRFLLLLFALALVVRPVLVSLYNSGLQSLTPPADASFSSHENSSSLTSDQQALKKIAKQNPRAKFALAPAFDQVFPQISKNQSIHSVSLRVQPRSRLFALRI